jgi:hypothetical protein
VARSPLNAALRLDLASLAQQSAALMSDEKPGRTRLSARGEAARAEREERLAAALRDNLRRRKVQARGRAASPEEIGEETGEETGPGVPRDSAPNGVDLDADFGADSGGEA